MYQKRTKKNRSEHLLIFQMISKTLNQICKVTSHPTDFANWNNFKNLLLKINIYL